MGVSPDKMVFEFVLVKNNMNVGLLHLNQPQKCGRVFAVHDLQRLLLSSNNKQQTGVHTKPHTNVRSYRCKQIWDMIMDHNKVFLETDKKSRVKSCV